MGTACRQRVSIKSRRLVSYEHRHLAAISYEVTVLNADAQIVIVSEMRNEHEDRLRKGDPRLHQTLKGKVLLPLLNSSQGQRVILGHKTEHSNLKLVCGIDHFIETAGHDSVSRKSSEDEGQVVFSCQGQSGRPIKIIKFMAYHTSQALSAEELCDAVGQTLDLAKTCGFDDLLKKQRVLLDDFWQRSDVHIEGDPDHPRHRAGDLQQAMRLTFQIFQASIRLEGVGIPAKGLTGQAYDGNYFWDIEVYVLPFLIYTYPQVARNLPGVQV